MKQILRLTEIMLRGNGFATFGSDSRKKRRFGSLGSLLLFLFLFLYLGIMMAASSMGLFRLLAPFSLTGIIPQLYLSAAAIMTFVFGAVYTISVFYYSSDVTRLLPLPLKASEIISAKLLVTASYIELIVLAFMLPSLTVYGYLSEAVWYYYPLMVFSIVLLPLIPLCLAAVLVIMLMRLTPFARNKDRFNTVSSLLLLVGIFGMITFIQSMANRAGSGFAEWIEAGTDSVSAVTMSVFPGVRQVSRLLVDGSANAQIIDLLVLILFAAMAWLLVMLVGRAFYFKGVVSVSMSGGSKSRTGSRELAAAGKSGSLFWTLVLKDVRILIRTPIFLMNNVIMNFLWPVFLIMPLLVQSEAAESLKQIRELAGQINVHSDMTISIVIMAGFAFSSFVAGTNGIAASALSREGKLLYIMKNIPVSYHKQLLAKVTVGVLMGLAGSIMAIVLAFAVLRPPVWLLLVVLVVLPGASVLPSMAGIIFDLLWPKLNWDNEQRAVKQNLNVLYGMLAALVIIAICSLAAYIFVGIWPLVLIVLILLPWIFAAVLYIVLRSISVKQMAGIEA